MRRESHSPAEAHAVPQFFSGGWTENRRSRPAIFSVSLAGHFAFAAFLALADWPALRPLPAVPDMAILAGDNERTIVFYNLSRDLPRVRPLEPLAGEQSARAQKRSPRQTIAANDRDAASDTQKIWDPASDRFLDADVQVPNIVASSAAPERFEMLRLEMNAPAAEPLPSGVAPVNEQAPAPNLNIEVLARMERLRFQQRQREPPAPSPQAIDAAAPPILSPAAGSPVNIEQLARFERLRFQPAPRTISQPESRPLDAGTAPQIDPAVASGLNLEQIRAFERLRYRMPTPVAAAPGKQALITSATPALVPAAVPQVNLSAVYRPQALRYQGSGRELHAPRAEALARIVNAAAPSPAGGAAGSAAPNATLNESLIGGGAAIPAPPPAAASRGERGTGGGGTGESDLAVVGLKPSPNGDLEVPRGRRPGRFSAAPGVGDGNGRIGVPANENGARVPNLSVSAAGPSGSASVPTAEPGTGGGAWRGGEESDRGLLAMNRLTGPGSVERLSADDLERAAQTPPAPKERAPLEDRTVYTMAINMPNISSYQGSWIVRYAQLEEEEDEAPFSAPAPLRKVDPKYVAQAALEGIEGEVLLYAVIAPDGAVRDAKVMRGIDDRLDQSALEAIEKWQFTPAKRSGAPIAIEALFSIPFQLSKLKQ